MKNPIIVPELRELILANKNAEIANFCRTGHPAIVAELISALSSKEVWQILKNAERPLRAEIFSHLDVDLQEDLVTTLNREELVHLLADMAPDDRADLFKRMTDEKQEAVLPALAHAEREDIRRLSAYEEGTAGSVMTSDYAMLPAQITAAQAIDRLRREAPNKETIYYAYVVDENRKLIGSVSLKDLILSRPNATIDEIMQKEVLFTRIHDDQEDAVRKIQKYDLIALPVVNEKDSLVGIITYDDAIDVINQENTEDMEKLMAIGGSHEHAVYSKTSSWGHFKNRAGWVVVLAMLGLISGLIVQKFEGLLLQFTILATFMPMLADTGGNTGSQSATLVVRALALKEISNKDVLAVLLKEFKVAILLGLLLGMITFGRVLLTGGEILLPEGCTIAIIGSAIALALSLQVVTATLIGAGLPMVASFLKLDPAVVASPALTTIVDITGLLIYFYTIKLIVGI
ncbi:MAG: magnesium transporter [Proteobacteria bacterium]|nr:magnesium transporter [Pseudomonadota bacterium]